MSEASLGKERGRGKGVEKWKEDVKCRGMGGEGLGEGANGSEQNPAG